MNPPGRKIPPNPAAITKVQAYIRKRLAGIKLEQLALHQRQRKKVSSEILETEKSYVKYLEQLGKFYLQPLVDGGHVKKPEHIKVFSQVEELRKINLFILDELEKRMSKWANLPQRDQRLGDIFAKLSPFLKIYSDYVSEYQSNLSEINKLFEKKASVLKKCMEKVPTDYDQTQTVQSMLIMPIQRIPRYRLLIGELLKYTAYEHSDYSELTKALDNIKDVGNRVEEVIRERQSIEKILEINKKVIRPNKRDLPDSFVELGRSYVFEGPLLKVSHKSNQERYLFLFSDALLYTKQISSNEFEGKIFSPLTATSITDLPDTAFVEIQNRISIQTPKKSFIFYARSPQEKKTWLDHLRNSIAKLEKNITNANKRRKSINSRPSMIQSADAAEFNRDSMKIPLTSPRSQPTSSGNSPANSPRSDLPVRTPSSEHSVMQRSPSSPNMQRALAFSLGSARKSISNGNSPAMAPKFSTVQIRKNAKRGLLPGESQWHSDEPGSSYSSQSDSPRSGEESPRKLSPRSDGSGITKTSNGVVINGPLSKTSSPAGSPPNAVKMAPRPPPRLSVSNPVDPTSVGTTAPQVPPVKMPPRTGLTGSNGSISPSSPKNSGEFSPGRPVPPQSPKGAAQSRPNDQPGGVNGSGPMAVGLNTPPMPPRRVSVGPNAVQPKVPPLNMTSAAAKRPVSGTIPKVPANPTTLPSAIGNSSPRGNNNLMLNQSSGSALPPTPPKKTLAKSPLGKAPLAKAPMPNGAHNGGFAVPTATAKQMMANNLPNGSSPKLMVRSPAAEQRPLAKSLGMPMGHARTLSNAGPPPPVPAAPPKRTQVMN